MLSNLMTSDKKITEESFEIPEKKQKIKKTEQRGYRQIASYLQ
mgnify:CR=1 FL=1